jgi:aminoglycoside phosphotransferase (APT) family kinase protein
MIEANKIALFLDTAVEALSHELLPELKSGRPKLIADNLLLLLSRIAGQLRQGEQICADRLPAWAQLVDTMPPDLHLKSTEFNGASAQDQIESVSNTLQVTLGTSATFDRLVHDLGVSGSDVSKWFHRAVDAAVDFSAAVENSYRLSAVDTAQAAETASPNSLRSKLNRYLETAFPDLGKEAVSSLDMLAGGSTKLTVFLQLKPNARLPDQVILRMDLPLSITGTSVLSEFPILSQVFDLGVLAPRPILVEGDPSILGGAFLLMSYIGPAVPAGAYHPKERARLPRVVGADFGRQLAAQLAHLHAKTTRSEGSDDSVNLALSAAIDALHARWRSQEKLRHSLVSDLAFAWLKANPLPRGRPVTLVHGDVGVHNMLATGGNLVGIIDWEMAHVGDPAEDMAACRMNLCTDILPWEDFRAAYIGAGGDPQVCDSKAVSFFSIWYYLRYGIMVQEVKANFLRNKRRDIVSAQIASHSADILLQYQARALDIARKESPNHGSSVAR